MVTDSPTVGHLHYSLSLATKNKAVTILEQDFIWTYVFIIFGQMSRVRIFVFSGMFNFMRNCPNLF